MTTESTTFAHNPQAVQTHLGILQGTIERMAGNSSAAKAWCITLVSAILVIVADKHQPRFVWLALIPTLLFTGLDAYYLALEKGFRKSYGAFVEKLHRGTIQESDFYAVEPMGKFPRLLLSALVSFSVWPFYFTLVLMIYLAKRLVV
jgi:hypothetical protein